MRKWAGEQKVARGPRPVGCRVAAFRLMIIMDDPRFTGQLNLSGHGDPEIQGARADRGKPAGLYSALTRAAHRRSGPFRRAAGRFRRHCMAVTTRGAEAEEVVSSPISVMNPRSTDCRHRHRRARGPGSSRLRHPTETGQDRSSGGADAIGLRRCRATSPEHRARCCLVVR